MNSTLGITSAFIDRVSGVTMQDRVFTHTENSALKELWLANK